MPKTALITGGTRGIGLAVARKLASEGWNIAVNCRSTPTESLLDELRGLSTDAEIFQADVSSFHETEFMVNNVKSRFGAIDFLVNNAGITRDGLLMRMSEADFDDVIAANLKGAFNMIRHTIRHFCKQRSGAILNISSIVGISGNAGQANYAASKAGIIGLTKSAARELAPFGVTCNAIAPGFIETDMTNSLSDNIRQLYLDKIPLNRFGQPEEIAEIAAFLSINRYITGQVFSVDGGLSM